MLLQELFQLTFWKLEIFFIIYLNKVNYDIVMMQT